MPLEEKINADLKAAMMAKDSKKLESIRAIKAVILLLKTSPEGYTEESEAKALQKEVKKRRETAEIYTAQQRPELAETELYQASVIEAYLPRQMNSEELKAEITRIIAATGASSPADMGKVMGLATKQMAGKADGKAISQMVKELLSK
jgi:uncharacterized protein YqeY